MIQNSEKAYGSSRLPELSLLNIIFCILVIFIHSSSEPVSILDKSTFSYVAVFIPWRLSAFVVQGFLVLSGIKLFLKPTDEFNYGKFLLKRLKTVVIPYVLWVCVYYTLYVLKGYFPFSATDLLGYIARGDLVVHFYFVIVIVQFYLLMPLWIKLVNSFKASCILPFALLITVILGQNLPSLIGLAFPDYLFPYNDRIFTTYLFYFICGCYIGKSYEAFKKELIKHKIAVSVIFAVTAILDGVLSLAVFREKAVLTHLETIHTLYVISAILFFFMLSVVLVDSSKVLSKPLSALDKACYAVYLSHPFCIFILDHYVVEFLHHVRHRYGVRLVLTYVLTFGLCIAYYETKRRFKRYEIKK